jgi:hypothetical protein
MKWLWKLIKWLLLLMLAIAVLFMLNLAYIHWRGPTDAQKAALERVEAGTPKPLGRNAFALMWLFDRDIADEELARIADEDVQLAETNAGKIDDLDEFPSARVPVLPGPATGSSMLCQAQEPECLALVGAHAEATRSELATYPRLLARSIELEGFDYLRDAFPPLPVMAFPIARNAQELRLSSLALAYVDGQRESRWQCSWCALHFGSERQAESILALLVKILDP